MSRQRLRMNERGDTLVEVVVALAILTSVLIATFAVANLTYTNGLGANQRSDAVALAQQEAEVFRNVRDNDPSLAATDKLKHPPTPNNPWTDYFLIQTLSSLAHTPTCGVSPPYYVKPLVPTGTKNSWKIMVKNNYVTTRTGTFDVFVTECFPPPFDINHIRFNINVSWPAPSGTQTSVLSTEIYNTTSIKQIEPTL